MFLRTWLNARISCIRMIPPGRNTQAMVFRSLRCAAVGESLPRDFRQAHRAQYGNHTLLHCLSHFTYPN